jgi:hypothetical protein
VSQLAAAVQVASATWIFKVKLKHQTGSASGPGVWTCVSVLLVQPKLATYSLLKAVKFSQLDRQTGVRAQAPGVWAGNLKSLSDRQQHQESLSDWQQHFKTITKIIWQIADRSIFDARGTGLSAVFVTELLCSQVCYIQLVMSLLVFAFWLSSNRMQLDSRYFLSFWQPSVRNLKVRWDPDLYAYKPAKVGNLEKLEIWNH